MVYARLLAPDRRVERALQLMRERGYVLVNADITLLLERPKIAPYRPAMLAALNSLFGRGAMVNLKAATNEQCDAIGRNEAVAAHAVVLLARSS